MSGGSTAVTREFATGAPSDRTTIPLTAANEEEETTSRATTIARRKWLTGNLPGLLCHSRRPIECDGVLVDHPSDDHHLLIRFAPFLLLDRFADRGKRLDSVASVEPGGVDLVHEPRSLRQTFGTRERRFEMHQRVIDVGLLRSRRRRDCAIEGGRAALQSRHRIAQRCELDE